MHSHLAESNESAVEPLYSDVCGQSQCADFLGLKLSSAFQPIFSLAQRQPVGYEALLRCWNADNSEPLLSDIFSGAAADIDVHALENVARDTHLRNFIAQRPPNSWLFLNTSPAAFVSAPRGADALMRFSAAAGLTPYRIVIEVVESAISDERALTAAVDYYRNQGCLVALDDFGVGHSNFGRVWSLEPDIVKLDRHLTRQAVESSKIRRMMANLVNMLHESGSLVVLEGVETEDDAMLAIDVDVDMVQGFFYAHPSNVIADRNSYPIVPGDLCRKHCDSSLRGEPARARRQLTAPMRAFLDSARALESDQPMDASCFRLLRHEGVECAYVLTRDGVQVGNKLVSAGANKVCDPRFTPLCETAGANWFRRPFFQNAINNPGQAQISTPYLSPSGAYLCVTLSIQITISGVPHVFCCDVNWDRLTRVGA